ncbi:MAG: dihydropteroate synthase [Rhodospirillales bacterium]|jgi:cobalamin-dependent methionine synthase I|nr:dihydropteroate synthase [Rhodospirillales bacterium]
MDIPGLSVIGDSINPGFKSARALFDNEDIEGIQALAKKQVDAGAAILDFNVGERATEDHAFLREVIGAIQAAVDVPLCFDYPNFEFQEVCLKAYNDSLANGQKPVINSIAETRWEMAELLKVRPARVILMASERMEDGRIVHNQRGEDVHAVAKRMINKLSDAYPMERDDFIVDISIGTLAADTEGLVRMALDGIRLIAEDPDLEGVYISGGLTNLVLMLPKDAVDGSPLKPQLQSAFLTEAIPLGLNMIMCTPWNDYRILPDDNFILQTFREIMQLKGMDALMAVMKLYK